MCVIICYSLWSSYSIDWRCWFLYFYIESFFYIFIITIISNGDRGCNVYYNRNDICFIILMHVRNIIIYKNFDYNRCSPVDFLFHYIILLFSITYEISKKLFGFISNFGFRFEILCQRYWKKSFYMHLSILQSLYFQYLVLCSLRTFFFFLKTKQMRIL